LAASVAVHVQALMRGTEAMAFDDEDEDEEDFE
jgi:hypothetical protein